MSLTTLIDELTDKDEKLRIAMQSGNAAQIESAADAFRAVLEQVKAQSAQTNRHKQDRDLRKALTILAPALERSRALAVLMADMTGQMRDLAAARTAGTRPALYARNGERFA